MITIDRTDELGSDAEVAAGFSDASFKHRVHVQSLTHFANIQRRRLEPERRRPGSNLQVRQAGEGIDQLISETLAKVILVSIRTQIQERQNGYRRNSLRCLVSHTL